jgi:hypothetical protein
MAVNYGTYVLEMLDMFVYAMRAWMDVHFGYSMSEIDFVTSHLNDYLSFIVFQYPEPRVDVGRAGKCID